ncbi:hypothetical protein [Halomonas koreensis]|uniref:Uncharacterized protein n=1 Tax=Halomonas koreensis TaxID=245385 RepID=A0ABU1FZQ9_9GAMM|nr:hypothetical protein [Halomonas koreensis]MDR5866160.1 hypothetical protein [Halomonas koreensis]
MSATISAPRPGKRDPQRQRHDVQQRRIPREDQGEGGDQAAAMVGYDIRELGRVTHNA